MAHYAAQLLDYVLSERDQSPLRCRFHLCYAAAGLLQEFRSLTERHIIALGSCAFAVVGTLDL